MPAPLPRVFPGSVIRRSGSPWACCRSAFCGSLTMPVNAMSYGPSGLSISSGTLACRIASLCRPHLSCGSCRHLAGSSVKPQGPDPYVLDPEHLVDCPRVGGGDRPQCVLAGGLDGQQCDVLVIVAGDRAAEDDDPAAGELVGEGGVLVPERLLADATLGVVPPSGSGKPPAPVRTHPRRAEWGYLPRARWP